MYTLNIFTHLFSKIEFITHVPSFEKLQKLYLIIVFHAIQICYHIIEFVILPQKRPVFLQDVRENVLGSSAHAESEQQDSNPRHHGYKPCALPLMLYPEISRRAVTPGGRGGNVLGFLYHLILHATIINLSNGHRKDTFLPTFCHSKFTASAPNRYTLRIFVSS